MVVEDVWNGRTARRRPPPAGSQTLLRGLDLLDHLAAGPVNLTELARRMGLAKTTTYRLATALTNRGFVVFFPRRGYQLGPKLLELGFLTQSQVDIVAVAKPHLELLAGSSGDTVHLGRLDRGQVLYLDKVPGHRRVEISSRVGDRQPLISTGLGKALLLDMTPAQRRRIFEADADGAPPRLGLEEWERRMRDYAQRGRTFDLEESEDQIRCVAAPVRDASGRIAAAISISSAAQYMDDHRMSALADRVVATARTISSALGWPSFPASAGRSPVSGDEAAAGFDR